MEKDETEKKPTAAVVKKRAPRKHKETKIKAKVSESENKFIGTGRRKTSVARVTLIAGEGHFSINGKSLEDYCSNRFVLLVTAKKPLEITNTFGRFDVIALVHGGGIASQIGALSQGISRALLMVSLDFRSGLKKLGLLRRDPRMKERKKYGHKRARKSFQYSKR